MGKNRKRLYTLLLMLTLVLTLSLGMSVSAAKKSVTLDKNKITVYVGETAKLKAAVTGTKKKPTWKSSKKTVATVSSNGVIKAKKAGTTPITLKQPWPTS